MNTMEGMSESRNTKILLLEISISILDAYHSRGRSAGSQKKAKKRSTSHVCTSIQIDPAEPPVKR